MVWIYKQTSGELWRDGKLINRDRLGYSGKGIHKNRNSSQYIKDWGPIPVGLYEVRSAKDRDYLGKLTLRLNPIAGTQDAMGGRSGFLIHGDKLNDLGNASNGCIILERQYREQIWNSGDHRLKVEGPHEP